VVETGRQPHTKYAWEMSQEEVDQLWAEAVVRWKAHESLYLDADRLVDAEALQETHMQSDARLGMIQQYLDILLNQSMVNPMPGASIKRDRVCAAEVLCELFGKDRGDIKRADTVEINGLINLLPDWIRYKSANGYTRFKLYGVQKTFVKAEESRQQNGDSVVIGDPKEDEF
jgi:putative DNA primase/helicase